jgi:uncharacterized protein YqeY
MLEEIIRKKMMEAMKEGDNKRKNVLSMLLAALVNGRKNKPGTLISGEEADIVSKEIKQAKETIETCPASRKDIIEENEYAISVLEEYMPKQLSASEINEIIDDVMKKIGLDAPTAKDKGLIMKNLMPLVKGKADGKLVNELVSKRFN